MSVDLQPEFVATFMIVPPCLVPVPAEDDEVESPESESRILELPPNIPDGSDIGDHSVDSLNPPSTHLASPPPRPTSSYMGMRSRPSSFELLKRVSNARKAGKSLDEMIHELQNDLYPLIAPSNYRAPSPGSYRVTVLRLEKWNDIYDSLQNELDEDMEEEEFNSDAFQVKIGCRPPHFSASLCAGKRRKREPEMDSEDRSSGTPACRKRRRAM
ncbi:hypothetical protein BDP27DRAFT_1320550 [Rhodocollybia butyracea]|uniref:Uncharacterized protein n=1 Tax=Rhodocollybia butyracea TaxID=206335 RepID=A0A9P5Q0E5_9AGAR|nr:hypothetical protein BDP27DRAFT_1320550 [Rhodocollybia butyracea]